MLLLARDAKASGPPCEKFLETILGWAKTLPPIRVGVVHPCDSLSLKGALAARDQNLIIPVLIGPRAKIDAAARECGVSLEGVEIVDAPHSHAAAEQAVDLVRRAQLDALMKGSLHTDELMKAVVRTVDGLRTERRISHVFLLDVPTYCKPLFVTDAAINIYPSLDDKRDIVRNAIDLAHMLGIQRPKVALLSAAETVDAKVLSTIDAAALCKMADRGQITGALLDGPLAFDNAISSEAARSKNIISPVAGDADILVAPDLEAGNILAKQLVFLAGAEDAGLVLGARAPIILTSRADGVRCRVASCALAQVFVHRRLETVTS
jgi:phosphotransacetylase